MLVWSSATAFSCISNASIPLAYSAPTTLPALVPATTTGAKPLASSILITPICAKPLAAPPPSATPILTGSGAASGGACTTGAGAAGRGSPPQAVSRPSMDNRASEREQRGAIMAKNVDGEGEAEYTRAVTVALVVGVSGSHSDGIVCRRCTPFSPREKVARSAG